MPIREHGISFYIFSNSVTFSKALKFCFVLFLICACLVFCWWWFRVFVRFILGYFTTFKFFFCEWISSYILVGDCWCIIIADVCRYLLCATHHLSSLSPVIFTTSPCLSYIISISQMKLVIREVKYLVQVHVLTSW